MNQDILRIALLQHDPVPADIDAAVQRLDHFANEAATAGNQLLCVPEASITGYNIPTATMQNVALQADGHVTRQIADICKRYNIAIAYGFAERDGNEYYNCVQLIDEQGHTVGKYRKCHLWGDLDQRLFTAGDTLNAHPDHALATIGGFKVGLLICYDIEFPESVRTLALCGAELILTPTGLMKPWREVPERVVPVRAYENQLYIAYANYCGNEDDIHYEGRSCIVGPDGNDLARAEQQPELLSATISRSAMQEQRKVLPYHRDRRPELYPLPA